MIEQSNLAVDDTSVVSIFFNNRAKSSEYADIFEGKRAFISFQTLEESLYGAYRAGWGARRTSELSNHLNQYSVVWTNNDLVNISARIRSHREKNGRKLQVADAWIAATALLLNCRLVADDGDFEDIPNLELHRVQSQ